MPFLPPMTGNGNHSTYLWWWLGDGLWHCFTHTRLSDVIRLFGQGLRPSSRPHFQNCKESIADSMFSIPQKLYRKNPKSCKNIQLSKENPRCSHSSHHFPTDVRKTPKKTPQNAPRIRAFLPPLRGSLQSEASADCPPPAGTNGVSPWSKWHKLGKYVCSYFEIYVHIILKIYINMNSMILALNFPEDVFIADWLVHFTVGFVSKEGTPNSMFNHHVITIPH